MKLDCVVGDPSPRSGGNTVQTTVIRNYFVFPLANHLIFQNVESGAQSLILSLPVSERIGSFIINESMDFVVVIGAHSTSLYSWSLSECLSSITNGATSVNLQSISLEGIFRGSILSSMYYEDDNLFIVVSEYDANTNVEIFIGPPTSISNKSKKFSYSINHETKFSHFLYDETAKILFLSGGLDIVHLSFENGKDGRVYPCSSNFSRIVFDRNIFPVPDCSFTSISFDRKSKRLLALLNAGYLVSFRLSNSTKAYILAYWIELGISQARLMVPWRNSVLLSATDGQILVVNPNNKNICTSDHTHDDHSISGTLKIPGPNSLFQDTHMENVHFDCIGIAVDGENGNVFSLYSNSCIAAWSIEEAEIRSVYHRLLPLSDIRFLQYLSGKATSVEDAFLSISSNGSASVWEVDRTGQILFEGFSTRLHSTDSVDVLFAAKDGSLGLDCATFNQTEGLKFSRYTVENQHMSVRLVKTVKDFEASKIGRMEIVNKDGQCMVLLVEIDGGMIIYDLNDEKSAPCRLPGTFNGEIDHGKYVDILKGFIFKNVSQPLTMISTTKSPQSMGTFEKVRTTLYNDHPNSYLVGVLSKMNMLVLLDIESVVFFQICPDLRLISVPFDHKLERGSFDTAILIGSDASQEFVLMSISERLYVIHISSRTCILLPELPSVDVSSWKHGILLDNLMAMIVLTHSGLMLSIRFSKQICRELRLLKSKSLRID